MLLPTQDIFCFCADPDKEVKANAIIAITEAGQWNFVSFI